MKNKVYVTLLFYHIFRKRGERSSNRLIDDNARNSDEGIRWQTKDKGEWFEMWSLHIFLRDSARVISPQICAHTIENTLKIDVEKNFE